LYVCIHWYGITPPKQSNFFSPLPGPQVHCLYPLFAPRFVMSPKGRPGRSSTPRRRACTGHKRAKRKSHPITNNEYNYLIVVNETIIVLESHSTSFHSVLNKRIFSNSFSAVLVLLSKTTVCFKVVLSCWVFFPPELIETPDKDQVPEAPLIDV